MSTNIHDFIRMFRVNALYGDVTWRAYDITPAIRDKHVQAALKSIDLNYAGELALTQFAALYEIPVSSARFVLGGWWVWSRLAQGRRLRVPRRARGATTLAGQSAEAP